MLLSKILKKLNINYKLNKDIDIIDVTRYKDKVNNGIIYVAFDKEHLKEAIKNKAYVVFGNFDYKNDKILYFKMLNIKKTYAMIIDLLYHKYYKGTKFIGVTGTNGKTTTIGRGKNVVMTLFF